MDATTHARTHVLGSYTAEGRKRHLLALEADQPDILQIVDVVADAAAGDDDRRQVENRVSCLGEACAIADDYIGLASKLGWPPMPDVWW